MRNTSRKCVELAAATLLLAGCAGGPPPAPEPAPAPAPAGGATPGDSTAGGTTVIPPAPPVVPERAMQQFAQAMTLLQAGRTTDAELEFKQLALAYPQFAAPSVNLGVMYQRAGKLPEAAEALEEAVRRDGSHSAAHTELGLVYRRLGRFKDAEGAYMEALRADPAYAPAHLNLGVLCDLFLGEPARALQAFEQYQQLSGNSDKRVANWIAELRGRLGSNPQPQTAENPP